ncbi:Synaptobrevin-1 [Echinococcus granulosus]|uniref:Synaptobrevin-1 n=1 Tax=Echinococcus granulosus TaxID=6210 RepID=W6UI43_ECHGR|nr:Synaptobrevin-1 [Echinococcus granulosus]EUB61155.1 Synaptobrevin-1 [Echinococcus granulosus]
MKSYAYSGQDRIQQQQAEVNEVVGIMKDNVARVLERDQRLSDLDHRADELQVHSREFESISRNIQRKYFWRNMKANVGHHCWRRHCPNRRYYHLGNCGSLVEVSGFILTHHHCPSLLVTVFIDAQCRRTKVIRAFTIHPPFQFPSLLFLDSFFHALQTVNCPALLCLHGVSYCLGLF